MMQEVRCKKCGKLLYKIDNPIRKVGAYVEIPAEYRVKCEQPKIETKCPRCGEMNTNKAKESVRDETFHRKAEPVDR